MKIKFPKTTPKELVSSLQEKLGGRKLGEMVSFETDDDHLKIVINKLGKSVLQFKQEKSGEELCYCLESEKIAFTHKAFKDEVTKKIMALVQDIGGSVEA